MRGGRDRREFTRVPICVDVEITSDGEPTISSRTKDLSMKGVYVICDEKLPAGTECLVSLVPTGIQKTWRIEANAKIARVDDGGMGVEFMGIVGLESYDHLRNIVMYNISSDVDQVEKELQSHLGLKQRER